MGSGPSPPIVALFLFFEPTTKYSDQYFLPFGDTKSATTGFDIRERM